MKRVEFEQAIAAYMEELARQDTLRSTGSTGKLMDVIVRDYILARGIARLREVRCRKGGAGSVDVTRRRLGTFEIKTGSGAVAYGNGLTKADMIAENICPNADYVVWAPFSKFINRGNFEDMFWVFTREDFIDCLEAIGKKGLQSSLHITKGGCQINIQTITPRMEDRLWDILDNIQTLRDWKEGLE